MSRRYESRRFANDLECSLDGELELSIFEVLALRDAGRELTYRTCRVEHVSDVSGITSSGRIENVLRLQNRRAPVGISQRCFFEQINLATQDARQLVLHRDKVEEAPIGIGGERHQYVNVTVRTEVVPHD